MASFQAEKCRHLVSEHEASALQWSLYKGKKVKADIALPGGGDPPSELHDATFHMGSHSVTCHPTQVNVPRLTPAMQAGTQFIYPGEMEG